jgi:VIT1/CCC1 family predicted Fe2+/Mn2+ transporter
MRRFELGLERPKPQRSVISAVTIGGAYIAGGLSPLIPYFIFSSALTALPFSVLVTLIALLVFGFVKGQFTGAKPIRGAFQTALIGGLAAGAAYLIAKAIA